MIKDIAMSFIGFVIRAVILVLLVLGLYRAGQKAYDFGFRIFTEKPMTPEPGRDVAVTIVRGDSVMDVAEMFEEKGLIRDTKLFYIQKKCSVYDGDIKPGFYTLNTSMTAEDMFAIIAGTKDDSAEGEEEEEDNSSMNASPLSQPAPLVDQAGEWEGAEEGVDDITIEAEGGEGNSEGGDSVDGDVVNIEVNAQ